MSELADATSSLPTSTPRESRALLGRMLHSHRRWVLAAALVLLGSAVAGLVVPPALGRIVDVASQARRRAAGPPCSWSCWPPPWSGRACSPGWVSSWSRARANAPWPIYANAS